MINSDESAFLSVMKTLDAMYEKKPNLILAQMVFKVMKPYSIEEFMEAVERHVSDPDRGMFYPKPADLIKAIEGKTNQTAKNALQGLIRHMELIGDSQPYKAPNKATDDALRAIGGWVRLNTLTYEQINGLESTFIETFNQTEATQKQLTSKEVQKLEH